MVNDWEDAVNETTLADIKKGHRAFEVKVHIWCVGQVTAIVSEMYFDSAPYKTEHGGLVADYFTSYCRISDPRLQISLLDRNIPENEYNCSRLFNTRDAADAYAVAIVAGEVDERDAAKLAVMLENRLDNMNYHDPIDDHVHYLDAIRYEDEDERDRADMEEYYEEERIARDERQKEIDRRGAHYAKTNLGAIMRDALLRGNGK
jgi:hypothetical protein